MADIIKEILKDLPDGKISEACFEGANIVLYTKDKEFFKNDNGMIRACVGKIKKRIELRPDQSLCIDQEKAEKEIRKLIPEESKVGNLIFDIQRSRVIVEAEKPGLAIGKQGSILRSIREKTFWVPHIRRLPPIRSNILETIRGVLFENNDYRRKFLDRVGHRVYDGWLRQKKHEWIRLTYLGSGRQVGRSCILLQTPESRILLDCGIDVSGNDDAYPILEAPEFRINELDAVIVSHSHMDHVGFVPYLFKFGYNGPVYCTAPTRDVSVLQLLDFVKIQKNDGREPIYTSDEIRMMVKHCITLNYEEVTDITPDVRITMYNSGHILGAAMVHLHIGNGLHNLVYGADMKVTKTMLLEGAHTSFPRCETLMIEATYGCKDCITKNRIETENALKETVRETVKRKGKILMPTLGSGRAQEIMILVESMVRNKEIPPIPIWVDGMVWDITAIHTAYPEFLSSQVRKLIFHKDQNPFLSECFKRVGSQKERVQIIEEEGSCIIIATSGMLVGGPSVQYLRALSSDKRNTLVFTCYQPEGSLGWRIRRGEREFMTAVGGDKAEPLIINMDVSTLEISGHADRKEMMTYMKKISPRPKKILVNHGENSRCLDLASSIHKQYRVETMAPRNLDSIRLK